MSLRSRIAAAAAVLVLATVLVTSLVQALVASATRAGVDAICWHAVAGIAAAVGIGIPAVLVAISTASSAAAIWRQAVAGGLAALGIGIPALLAAFWLARSVVAPVRQAVAVAESIAAGDLTTTAARGDRHELGRLLAALGTMTGSLGGLIGRIKSAGAHLADVAPQVTTALANQERAVRSVSRSANEIAASVAQISATSEHLLETTGSVTGVAREAAQVADQGRGGLESMAASMQQLDEAMNAFTRKLATISQRASGITAVVTTIAKIADQTNLLSVNATIEAEKAGESGRGFRIVAQEIRRLADQTALATKDIERMVRDMQTAVSSGTMEMDRFRNEVSARISEVAEVSASLGRIIEPVQAVTRSLDKVHDGVEAQSQGARQIPTRWRCCGPMRGIRLRRWRCSAVRSTNFATRSPNSTPRRRSFARPAELPDGRPVTAYRRTPWRAARNRRSPLTIR